MPDVTASDFTNAAVAVGVGVVPPATDVLAVAWRLDDPASVAVIDWVPDVWKVTEKACWPASADVNV